MERMVHACSPPALLCGGLVYVALHGCWSAVCCPCPCWPFLCIHVYIHFCCHKRRLKKSICSPVRKQAKEQKKSACSNNCRLALFSFEAYDGWGWSIIQKPVKVVIQDEDSKSQINYPPAASEFSSTSCHKDARGTNVSVGDTCCSDSYSLAVCMASSVLLQVNAGLWGTSFPTQRGSGAPVTCKILQLYRVGHSYKYMLKGMCTCAGYELL